MSPGADALHSISAGNTAAARPAGPAGLMVNIGSPISLRAAPSPAAGQLLGGRATEVVAVSRDGFNQ
jgi:hypothetical protein